MTTLSMAIMMAEPDDNNDDHWQQKSISRDMSTIYLPWFQALNIVFYTLVACPEGSKSSGQMLRRVKSWGQVLKTSFKMQVPKTIARSIHYIQIRWIKECREEVPGL